MSLPYSLCPECGGFHREEPCWFCDGTGVWPPWQADDEPALSPLTSRDGQPGRPESTPATGTGETP